MELKRFGLAEFLPGGGFPRDSTVLHRIITRRGRSYERNIRGVEERRAGISHIMWYSIGGCRLTTYITYRPYDLRLFFRKQRARIAIASRYPIAGKELRSLFAYVRYESESRSNLEPFYLQCTRDIDVARRQPDNVYNYTAVYQSFFRNYLQFKNRAILTIRKKNIVPAGDARYYEK